MEKKIEKIFCYMVSIIVLVLIILTIKKIIFLPALLLMTSLLLFGLLKRLILAIQFLQHKHLLLQVTTLNLQLQ